MNWDKTSATTSARRGFSRRQILTVGSVAGVAGALSIPMIAPPANATSRRNRRNDAEVLNNALMYEHAAIWAYTVAAGKLTNTSVGQAVMAIALANKMDHEQHRDTLTEVVASLGGTPLTAESSYDVSSYINNGEGNLDSDVNIAKLALALETDAAIAYTKEISRLRTPELITAGASIGATEASHATLIRSAFKSLGVDLAIIPASFVNEANRSNWVLSV